MTDLGVASRRNPRVEVQIPCGCGRPLRNSVEPIPDAPPDHVQELVVYLTGHLFQMRAHCAEGRGERIHDALREDKPAPDDCVPHG